MAVIAAAWMLVVLGACGTDDDSGAARGGAGATIANTASGFAAIERAAQGQTVRWWMYGGDDRLNAYVDDVVTPAAARAGITLRRVPVTDTADAVQRVVAERRAGKRSGGGVDLVWINGENFAAGKRAGLWLKDWATTLPNRRFVDPADPTITTDFQTPVDGQESPWSRAAFVFAADGARVPAPPQSFDALLAYAKANPGRVTYPAPPDFTGSAFVRQVVAAKGQDGAFAYLKALKPFLYRQGRTYPKSEDELAQLLGNGKVDFAMSYDAAFVRSQVRKGTFPKTVRPFLIEGSSLQNVSFVTIPANASSPAGAQVLANLLLDPALQAKKADPAVLGIPTVLDAAKVPPASRRPLTASTSGPYVLRDLGRPLSEVAADEVAPLEARWKREVLRG
ncbi:Protein YnjB [Paraconexibacter sp. AEG42_29]|uniref:Protein YnjB n=2 Tax=Paraconexibacter sp. AEG42_29 TaxID=2997339 RepID=A0AAU7AYY5_9ACTN